MIVKKSVFFVIQSLRNESNKKGRIGNLIRDTAKESRGCREEEMYRLEEIAAVSYRRFLRIDKIVL